jgi:hypothetical protein
MELPSCPSCKQSVLDDEAEDCPFCGAPLKKGATVAGGAAKANPARPPASSKPTAPSKPTPSRPTAPSKPAAPPASSRPASTSKPANPQRPSAPSSPSKPPAAAPGKKSPEDAARDAANEELADSLKVDSTAGLDVPVASRQRSQSRPYKVRCPMCDTVGYVPRSAAGKDVRCANRECMVPVFTAPRPEKKQEEEKPKKKPITRTQIMMVVGALAAIGIAVWFFFQNQPPEATKNKDPDLSGQTGTQLPPAQKTDGDAAKPAPEKPLVVAEEQGAALAFMAKASREKSHNRSRPLCQRLTAHTAAECGDLVMAQTFLDELKRAESGLAFYRVAPLTSIASRQLKAGDREAAGKALDDAVTTAADLPSLGAFTVDSVAWLAAALTAAGRDKDALALVGKFPATGPDGRLGAAEARAEAWNSYDIETADRERPLYDVASLQLPLIVEIAVARGLSAEALRLVQSITDESLRAECEVAWLVAVERAKVSPGATSPAGVDTAAVLAKLKPAAQARCHAQIARLRAHNNDRPGAENELKAALAALGSTKAAEEFTLPSLKGIYNWHAADPGPARQDALAFADIAAAQAALGQTEPADQSLATALDCVRSTAPSVAAVAAKVQSASSNRAGLKDDLHTQLKLRETQVEAAFEQYRGNLRKLGQAADARALLELEILDTALAWADPSAVWKLIGTRATTNAVDRKELLLITPLPWQLMARLRSQGQSPDAGAFAAIQKAVGDSQPNPVGMLDAVVFGISDHEPTDLANGLKSIENVERPDRERAGLFIADRLVAAGDFHKAFQFSRLIDDPAMKEKTMEWCAARACRLGQARPVRDLLRASNTSFVPTELVSAWRGFLIGLLARERAEPEATSAAPPPAKAPAKDDAKQAQPAKG